MKVLVLGSAAGGGFPQWNCNCSNCRGLRGGTVNARPRTQSSIAIGDDSGEKWILINASPDIRTQLEDNRQLQLGGDQRGTRIEGVVLVDSQIDHTSGLLFLREGEKLPVYATSSAIRDLSQALPILNVLDLYCGTERISLKDEDECTFHVGSLEHLKITSVPLVSKGPPYSENCDERRKGRAIALFIEDTRSGRSLFYSPGLETVDEQITCYFEKSDVIMVDGTFYTDNEMETMVGNKRTAKQMGHLPLSGSEGMLAQLGRYPDKRRILIHINNTNPILIEDSVEHAEVVKNGIAIAYDGWEFDV